MRGGWRPSLRLEVGDGRGIKSKAASPGAFPSISSLDRQALDSWEF